MKEEGIFITKETLDKFMHDMIFGFAEMLQEEGFDRPRIEKFLAKMGDLLASLKSED